MRTDELRAALADGVLAPNTPVWRRGWTDWKSANEVPELMQAAFAAENGQALNVPPPPLFVVAAQAQFEGPAGAKDLGPEEPPPPPKYVPAAPAAKPAKGASPAPAKVEAKPAAKGEVKAEAKTAATAKVEAKPALTRKPEPAKPPAAKPRDPPKKKASVAPPPLPKKASVAPPPLPKKGSVAPPPLPKKGSVAPPPLPKKPSVAPPSEQGWDLAEPTIPKAPAAPALAEAAKPKAPPPESTVEMLDAPTIETQAMTATAAAALTTGGAPKTIVGVPSLNAASLKISTPTVSPAPPPMPLSNAAALEAAREREKERIEREAAARDVAPPTAPAPTKYPTLIDFDGGGSPPPSSVASKKEEAKPSSPPPIVVPSPSKPGAGAPGAVTQAPPWGEGAVEIASVKMPPAAVLPKVPPPEETLVTPGTTRPAEARVSLVEQPPPQPEGSTVSVVKAPPLGSGKAATLVGIAPVTSPKPPIATMVGMPAPKAADTEPVLPPEPEPTPEPDRDRVALPPRRAPAPSVPDAVRQVLARPRWQLGVGAGAAVLVLLGLGGVIARVFSGGNATSSPSASATTPAPPASSLQVVASSTAPAASSSAPAPAAAPIACKVTGEAKLIAPKAVVGSGVEAVALRASIGLGFAVGPKEASVVTLDPANASSTGAKRLKADGAIRRVTPLGEEGTVDFDRKGDPIHARRTVGTFDVGVVEQQLVIAPHGKDEGLKLWSLETDAPVEALRGVTTNDGVALAYRHAGAIWVGGAKGDRAPIGQPVRVAGLGPQVGSPAIAAAASGDVLVAWADRAQASDPWGLRLIAWRPGEAAKAAITFKLPAGGLGEHAMSPGLAALPGGRFLLVWTEGPVSSHQVRAQVLGADGSAAGDAFAVSADGVNAGQGQAAVLSDGRGAVAFLASTGKTFDVRATPIQCQ